MFDGTLSSASGRGRAWIDSLFVDHAILRMTWTNFRTVIPGRVYRCNHPTPWRLAMATRRLHLKTLVNLRGHRQCGSDALSRDAAHRLGLRHIDMAFESRNAPHRDRIERFEKIYRSLTFPMLMHCKSGADRTGLAAGLVLLFEGGTARDALRQLSWKNGHFNSSRTGVLDAFFLRYQAEAEGRIPFMQWVRTEYDEDRLRHDFRAGKIAAFLNDSVLRRE
ncbi:tyrosine-protein phosphatase [Gluconacetobacter entanii]|uniref:Tyrosine-protein phosphatase n=1 Tax=Gluconacetobacter entanii TaxID=108528 RepID=A0ABT3K5I3_9PROT|nr:tyrosine-protein phosphatase [Gluconacetobacter entanii]MBE7620553.1 protein tyrosine phosphatase [Komagataeibacter sp. FXV2]MBY4639813.1 tyrosine-protein phosphatase [Gluconacetobacter entanii]MCW4580512.1 tyrosine-protein phosphatase [Gluconacetobacter entanii]MCW4583867.1 tyrosine-protein phosphatase [Gluconacetobacter entanii]MCW4587212.1 tyrosine-protein phosphatase [Gluconacetobacter entanii]